MGQRLEFHKALELPAAFCEVTGARIVRDAENPGPETTAAIEKLEAAPKFDVHLLEQVPLAVRVRFVAAGQTAQCIAVCGVSLDIDSILILRTQVSLYRNSLRRGDVSYSAR